MARLYWKRQQPPIDRAHRPSEGRRPWVGLLLAVAGAGLLVAAVFQSYVVAGAQNNRMTQPQLVEQVTHGGIVFGGTAADGATRRALALKGGQKSADPCPT